LRICITSLYSYPLFNPACISPFGGSETRISLIAKELAKYPDLEVNLIVYDHGQPLTEKRDGVILHRWTGKYCPIRADISATGCRPQMAQDTLFVSQGPGVHPSEIRRQDFVPLQLRMKFFLQAHLPYRLFALLRRLYYLGLRARSMSHRVWDLYLRERPFGYIRGHRVRKVDISIYDKIDAKVHLMTGNHDMAARLAYYCRRRGSRYIMISGSDPDFLVPADERAGRTDIYGSSRSLMAYTIEAADQIIVQTRRQAELAKTLFQRDSIVIPNPVDLTPLFPPSPAAKKILWVGKSDDRVKQPELFVNLAQKLPEFAFSMIMNLGLESVHRHIMQRVADVPNLSLLTYVPFGDVEKYYAEARLLVNTSKFEGFPNTFLQAAKYGVPVVSLQVDPEGMIAGHGCGLECGGDFDKLVDNVCRLMSDADLYSRASANIRAYIAKHHDKDALVPKYRDVIFGC
jgi:glycosyltransferase involved in cell wall biosynthesis